MSTQISASYIFVRKPRTQNLGINIEIWIWRGRSKHQNSGLFKAKLIKITNPTWNGRDSSQIRLNRRKFKIISYYEHFWIKTNFGLPSLLMTDTISCKDSKGTLSKHRYKCHNCKRSWFSYNVKIKIEPIGLNRDVGKRSDGMTLIPWRFSLGLKLPSGKWLDKHLFAIVQMPYKYNMQMASKCTNCGTGFTIVVYLSQHAQTLSQTHT